MDFIKETILTLTQKEKEEFERFLSRKQSKKERKDLQVFDILFDIYHRAKEEDKTLKGDQNYHAIRKRLSKELENFLVLKHCYIDNNFETTLLMIKHFISLKRYEIAWELLIKEEQKAESVSNAELGLRIQRMKLDIMPYYGGEHFEETKKRVVQLRSFQSKADRIQLTFIQIQNALSTKIHKGDVDSTQLLIDDILYEYDLTDQLEKDPFIYFKIIETLRAKYLIDKKYKSFAQVVQRYYDKMQKSFNYENIDYVIRGQVEYIMAHAYFRVRNFHKSKDHLDKLFLLMQSYEIINKNYSPRYISLKSSIDVFENRLEEAIKEHQIFLEKYSAKLTVREQLNLSLNLVAYQVYAGLYSKANKILIHMHHSDSYYQKHMGREWLIRKELIRAVVQVELKNVEIAIKILEHLKSKHADMFESEQYSMVKFYINTLLKYLNDPYQTSEEAINQMEQQTNFINERLFDDPKLLAFYAWLKSKVLKRDLYEVMLDEYRNFEVL